MLSVKIGEKDIYTEYGFYVASVEIGEPKVQTKYVDVPMRDGSIDCTSILSDAVRYDDRTIKIKLLRPNADEDVLSEMADYLHGQKKKIIFSNDIAFYYLGRIEIGSVKRNNGAMTLTLTATCEPFKYDVTPSNVDWEWDSFDFERGIINELGQIVVSGQETVTLICRRAREFPTFEASSQMTLTFKNDTYTIKKGIHKVYNLFFDKGENEMKFTGNGTVSITYIGGSL